MREFISLEIAINANCHENLMSRVKINLAWLGYNQNIPGRGDPEGPTEHMFWV